MKSVDLLNQKLEEFQKRMHKINKKTMNNEDFLHSGEMSVIKFIRRYNDRCNKNPTLVNISNIIGISQATVTTIADRLIKKGLITKEVNLEDKRAKLVSLTAKGEEYLQKNQERRVEFLENISNYIGDEDSETLARILEKVNTYLEDLEK